MARVLPAETWHLVRELDRQLKLHRLINLCAELLAQLAARPRLRGEIDQDMLACLHLGHIRRHVQHAALLARGK